MTDRMKEWDMNIIISCFLGFMGMMAGFGWVFISFFAGTSSGTEVPLSIASGLSGVLGGKGLAEAKYRKELSNLIKPPDDNTDNNIEIRG